MQTNSIVTCTQLHTLFCRLQLWPYICTVSLFSRCMLSEDLTCIYVHFDGLSLSGQYNSGRLYVIPKPATFRLSLIAKNDNQLDTASVYIRLPFQVVQRLGSLKVYHIACGFGKPNLTINFSIVFIKQSTIFAKFGSTILWCSKVLKVANCYNSKLGCLKLPSPAIFDNCCHNWLVAYLLYLGKFYYLV